MKLFELAVYGAGLAQIALKNIITTTPKNNQFDNSLFPNISNSDLKEKINSLKYNELESLLEENLRGANEVSEELATIPFFRQEDNKYDNKNLTSYDILANGAKQYNKYFFDFINFNKSSEETGKYSEFIVKNSIAPFLKFNYDNQNIKYFIDQLSQATIKYLGQKNISIEDYEELKKNFYSSLVRRKTQVTPRETFRPSPAPTTASPTTSPAPTLVPSGVPTGVPSKGPSPSPTGVPSGVPTGVPTFNSSPQPSRIPTATSTSRPSAGDLIMPTLNPNRQPTSQPSNQPSGQPTSQPSSQPSNQPSVQPSNQNTTNNIGVSVSSAQLTTNFAIPAGVGAGGALIIGGAEFIRTLGSFGANPILAASGAFTGIGLIYGIGSTIYPQESDQSRRRTQDTEYWQGFAMATLTLSVALLYLAERKIISLIPNGDQDEKTARLTSVFVDEKLVQIQYVLAALIDEQNNPLRELINKIELKENYHKFTPEKIREQLEKKGNFWESIRGVLTGMTHEKASEIIFKNLDAINKNPDLLKAYIIGLCIDKDKERNVYTINNTLFAEMFDAKVTEESIENIKTEIFNHLNSTENNQQTNNNIKNISSFEQEKNQIFVFTEGGDNKITITLNDESYGWNRFVDDILKYSGAKDINRVENLTKILKVIELQQESDKLAILKTNNSSNQGQLVQQQDQEELEKEIAKQNEKVEALKKRIGLKPPTNTAPQANAGQQLGANSQQGAGAGTLII